MTAPTTAGGPRCPRCHKRLSDNDTARARECVNCTYTEPYRRFRAPMVTAESARSLVAELRRRRATGQPVPARRVGPWRGVA